MRDNHTSSPSQGGFTQGSSHYGATGATGTSGSGQKLKKTLDPSVIALQERLANVKSPVYLGTRAGGVFTKRFSCKGAYTFFADDVVLVCPNTKDGTDPDGSVLDLAPQAEDDYEHQGNLTLVVGRCLIGFERSKYEADWLKRIPKPVYPPGEDGETVGWEEMDVVDALSGKMSQRR